MSFRTKLKYYLVHTLGFTNKDAQTLIQKGAVEIDGKTVSENRPLLPESEIKVQGTIKRAKTEGLYLKFYKPVGYESTLNPKIENNLSAFFRHYQGLAIAGRLDKQSEGLLLLSNDGKWVEKICHPKFEKEKEYLVELDREADQHFFDGFQKGVDIWQYTTAPCFCEKTDGNGIRVILKEGKNRQIRRMCKVLGYEVRSLQRIRIGQIQLGTMKPGESEPFNPDYS